MSVAADDDIAIVPPGEPFFSGASTCLPTTVSRAPPRVSVWDCRSDGDLVVSDGRSAFDDRWPPSVSGPIDRDDLGLLVQLGGHSRDHASDRLADRGFGRQALLCCVEQVRRRWRAHSHPRSRRSATASTRGGALRSTTR
jgi:hypothetical protein